MVVEVVINLLPGDQVPQRSDVTHTYTRDRQHTKPGFEQYARKRIIVIQRKCQLLEKRMFTLPLDTQLSLRKAR